MISFKVQKCNTLKKLGILFLIIKVIFSYSKVMATGDSMDDLLSMAGVACLLGPLIIKKIKTNRQTLKLHLLILGVTLITCYHVKNLMLFISVLTILSIDYEELDEIISYIFQVELILIIFNAIAAFIKIPFGYNIFTSVSGERCINYGFSHPNVFSCLLFNLIAMWIWLNYDKATYKQLMIIEIIVVASYFTTGTRTILVECTFFLMLFVLIKKKKLSYLHKVAAYIFPLLSIVTYITISNYQKGYFIITKINELLSGRIRLGAYAMAHYGYSLLGQRIKKGQVFGWDSTWQMSKFTTFDNLYAMLLVQYGIVWLILISVSFYLLAKEEDSRISLMIIIWSIFSITEGLGINCYMLFPILLIAKLVKKRECNVIHNSTNIQCREILRRMPKFNPSFNGRKYRTITDK